ncbi:MAG: hypothetical protein EAZ88_23745 [Oscillatoriales cyanobacterium]|nr:MAG: hypothetical protein EAZ88_23745 [Oscillatoriales cyanobacterium]
MIYNSDATGDDIISCRERGRWHWQNSAVTGFDRKRYYLLSRAGTLALAEFRTGRILLLLDLTGNDIISCRERGRSHWQNSAVTRFEMIPETILSPVARGDARTGRILLSPDLI